MRWRGWVIYGGGCGGNDVARDGGGMGFCFWGVGIGFVAPPPSSLPLAGEGLLWGGAGVVTAAARLLPREGEAGWGWG